MIPPAPTSVINDASQLKRQGLDCARGGDFRSAEPLLSEAVRLRPGDTALKVNLAIVLHSLGRYDQALEMVDSAIALDATRPEAFSNRCLTLTELHRFDEAIECARRAIELEPRYPEAWNNLGASQYRSGKVSEAIESYKTALKIRPEYGRAWANLGFALTEVAQLTEGRHCLAEAMRLTPHLQDLQGSLLHLQMRLCEWDSFDQSTHSLIESISAGKPVCPAFAVLSIIDLPSLHRQCASITAARLKDRGLKDASEQQKRRLSEGGKVRLGYFSADFFNHATTHLIHGVIASHNRDHFDVIGFSLGPPRNDVEAKKIRDSFDQIYDIHALSDQSVLELCEALQIDIAIDLKGYTQDSRPGLFAARVAPIQVSFLGYPGTLALPEMDYLIADKTLITADTREHYDEHIVFMPRTYQCNSEKKPPDSTTARRTTEGLPEKAFVFCCFNNTFKITPGVFKTWMQILDDVPNAVLWLLRDNSEAENNLRRHASAHGINPDRLIFANRVPPSQHLDRHALADVFLDTTPYNAHTTASDALRMGVPLITILGRSFPARVAASLLNAVGLSELVTESLPGYRRLAVDLATDPHRLSTIRRHLDIAVRESPVFDPAAFARNLEKAFTTMMRRSREGQAPQDIEL